MNRNKKGAHYKNTNMVSEFKVLISFLFFFWFKFLACGFHRVVIIFFLLPVGCILSLWFLNNSEAWWLWKIQHFSSNFFHCPFFLKSLEVSQDLLALSRENSATFLFPSEINLTFLLPRKLINSHLIIHFTPILIDPQRDSNDLTFKISQWHSSYF